MPGSGKLHGPLRVIAALAVLAALLSAVPATCSAWGRLGHQIVALIAEKHLSPEAKARVVTLLAVPVTPAAPADDSAVGLSDLAIASTWADDIVSLRRETGPWHYVDIPATEPRYVAARDCPDANCIVVQIERLRNVLGAAAPSATDQAEALRFLVHFVADIHQPLHTTCNVLPPRHRRVKGEPPPVPCGGQLRSDRGGNEINVRFGDLGINLHQVWDTELLYELRGRVSAVADRLDAEITPAQRQAWAAGSAEDWANESHEIAQRIAYGLLPKERRIVIPLRYETEARLAAETQLKRAGVRLAWLLNQAFNPPPPVPAQQAAPPLQTAQPPK